MVVGGLTGGLAPFRYKFEYWMVVGGLTGGLAPFRYKFNGKMQPKAAGRKPSGVTATNVHLARQFCNFFLYLFTTNDQRPMHTDPIGYFITWTCYGTWMPGDDRGWTKWHKGDQVPQPLLADWCRDRMLEEAVTLDRAQMAIVNETVARHCELRRWYLHAVNCRSNHCHVVVTAKDYSGEQVRDQFKAWCTRKLNDAAGRQSIGAVTDRSSDGSRFGVTTSSRDHWWTRKGSVRYLFDEESLEAAILYTLEGQDRGGSKAC